MENKETFLYNITSKHKSFDFHINELIKYRDLVFLFIKRDFTARYKQTILGPLWAVIQPLLTTVIFTVVFGKLAGLTTSDTEGDYAIPGYIFYMCGTICWTYFSTNVNDTSNTFIRYQNIMGKVYFPRIVGPVSTAFTSLIPFSIQLVMLFGFIAFEIIRGGMTITITPWLLLLPVSIIELMILSTGIGLIISSITTKYRDLSMLVSFGLSLWQYATPVAYGLQLIPEKYHSIYLLNPVTSIITTFRYSILGFGYFNLSYYIYTWFFTIAVMFIGLLIFSKIERTFMDTI